MQNVIAFPTPKPSSKDSEALIDNHEIMSRDAMLVAAQEACDRIAAVTEWLERIGQRLAEH